MQTHTVIGPPGTGKTTYLARQVSLASEAGEAPSVVSLTKAAAREAAGRDLPIDRERVSTLHSQCFRALDAGDVADSPKQVARWNKEHPGMMLSGGVNVDGDTIGQPASETPADELMLAWQSSRHRGEPTPGRCVAFVDRWQAWKASEDMLDFTDLIEHAYLMVAAAPGEPTVIFTDEAQDLSLLEMALVEKWGRAAGRLVVVGDPWQNLYEWRGTDPTVMGTPDVVLSQSYRVPAEVHATAIGWMSSMPGYEEISYEPRNDEGRVSRSASTWGKPQYGGLLSSIEADVSAGRTAMVITTCDYMLRPLVACLRERGVPFHNPYKRRHGGWNPLRPAAKGKQSASTRVLSFLRSSRGETYQLTDVVAWTNTIAAKHLACTRAALEAELIDNDFLDSSPYAWVAERLTAEALAAWDTGDLDWLEANLLKQYEPMRFAIKVARSRGADALDATPQVVVGTIHSVKGGEADSVYLAPDLSPSATTEWRGTGRAAVYRAFYVGMTRARESLTLLQPATSNAVPL